MFIFNNFSTCFGHHYAYLQENKTYLTACVMLRWFCCMWLVAVVGRCLVGCEHCEGYCFRTLLRRRSFFPTVHNKCPSISVEIPASVFRMINTGLFEMIVGVLTTCHTNATWCSSICVFYLIEQHSKFLLHIFHVFYMYTIYNSTNISEIINFVPNCLYHVSGDGFSGSSDSYLNFRDIAGSGGT